MGYRGFEQQNGAAHVWDGGEIHACGCASLQCGGASIREETDGRVTLVGCCTATECGVADHLSLGHFVHMRWVLNRVCLHLLAL